MYVQIYINIKTYTALFFIWNINKNNNKIQELSINFFEIDCMYSGINLLISFVNP